MSILFNFDRKIFLVTGASSGIGRQIAYDLSKAGATLILTGRNINRLEETKALCPNDTFIYPKDLLNIDELPKFVRELAKKYGPLSGMVHSAGIEQTLPLRAIQPKKLLEVIIVNALSGVMLMKGFAARGTFAKNSSTVFISSIAGHVGNKGLIGYSMSKGALEQMVKCLAIELLPLSIRVNAIAPAQLKTPMLTRYNDTISEEQVLKNLDAHPSGLGSPEDVASATLFLLSEESKYITGVSLLVDGGYCAQ